MQVNVMLKELPEEEFGRGINFREYSFLDNPSMPQQVYASDLHRTEKPIIILTFCLSDIPITYFRWKIHGLMCIFVKKDHMVVMFQTAQVKREFSSYLSRVQKKR